MTLREFMELAEAQDNIEIYDFETLDYISKDFKSESDIHKEAVRLRKLPDELLVRAASAKAASRKPLVRDTETRKFPVAVSDTSVVCAEGTETGRDTFGVKKLLTALEEGRCPGVKGATTYKIAKLAREMGLV